MYKLKKISNTKYSYNNNNKQTNHKDQHATTMFNTQQSKKFKPNNIII